MHKKVRKTDIPILNFLIEYSPLGARCFIACTRPKIRALGLLEWPLTGERLADRVHRNTHVL